MFSEHPVVHAHTVDHEPNQGDVSTATVNALFPAEKIAWRPFECLGIAVALNFDMQDARLSG